MKIKLKRLPNTEAEALKAYADECERNGFIYSQPSGIEFNHDLQRWELENVNGTLAIITQPVTQWEQRIREADSAEKIVQAFAAIKGNELWQDAFRQYSSFEEYVEHAEKRFKFEAGKLRQLLLVGPAGV